MPSDTELFEEALQMCRINPDLHTADALVDVCEAHGVTDLMRLGNQVKASYYHPKARRAQDLTALEVAAETARTEQQKATEA